MQTKTTKLRFSPDDLADAKVRRAAEKAEKAVEKADAAKARLPSKKLRTKTTTAQAQGEKLRFGKKEIQSISRHQNIRMTTWACRLSMRQQVLRRRRCRPGIHSGTVIS